uniref:Uncharacterized protein n=1 Tax=Arundo donax TaxID=35708 RepID=A0A0A8ZMK2_ARUDO
MVSRMVLPLRNVAQTGFQRRSVCTSHEVRIYF